ncbi:MAG: class II aldolase/adducin family protein [Planctomycetaceae bacterium]|nr:class II aldolase/adducin family protein [Planctomycetaceae bacterium]
MASDYGEAEAREDVAAAHRLAVLHGLNEGVWNHISFMGPETGGRMVISPGHTHWSQITAGNLALMDVDGTFLSGLRPPIRAAWIIHAPAHRARPDAKCVMHVHAPYLTAMSIRSDMRFEPRSSQQAARFHNEVVYYEVYDGTLSGEDEGARMAETLGNKRVLILRNHGVLIAADSVAKAYLDLYELERACMYQLLATAGGGSMSLIPEEVAESIGEFTRRGKNLEHFQGMKRWVAAVQPDYAG